MLQAKCTNCGAGLSVTREESTFICEYCRSTNIVDNAIALGKVEVDITKDIQILRKNLALYVQENSIDEILRVSQKLLDWIPQDFVAYYFFSYAKSTNNQPRFLYEFLANPLPHTVEESTMVLEHISNFSDLRDKKRVLAFIEKIDDSYLGYFDKRYHDRLTKENDYANIPRDVFICHSSHDITVATKVLQSLEQDGNTCWISTRNLRPGDAINYWENIEKAIDNSRIVLIIGSQESMVSKDVQRELEYAHKNNKKIIEYKIDHAEHTTFFKHITDGSKWVQATADDNKPNKLLLQRVYDELRGNIIPSSVPLESPKEEIKPKAKVRQQRINLDKAKLRRVFVFPLIGISVLALAILIVSSVANNTNDVAIPANELTKDNDSSESFDEEKVPTINLELTNEISFIETVIQGQEPSLEGLRLNGESIEYSKLVFQNPQVLEGIGIQTLEAYYVNSSGLNSNVISIEINIVPSEYQISNELFFGEAVEAFSTSAIILNSGDLLGTRRFVVNSQGNEFFGSILALFGSESKEVLWSKSFEGLSSIIIVNEWDDGSITLLGIIQDISSFYVEPKNKLILMNIDYDGNILSQREFDRHPYSIPLNIEDIDSYLSPNEMGNNPPWDPIVVGERIYLFSPASESQILSVVLNRDFEIIEKTLIKTDLDLLNIIDVFFVQNNQEIQLLLSEYINPQLSNYYLYRISQFDSSETIDELNSILDNRTRYRFTSFGLTYIREDVKSFGYIDADLNLIESNLENYLVIENQLNELINGAANVMYSRNSYYAAWAGYFVYEVDIWRKNDMYLTSIRFYVSTSGDIITHQLYDRNQPLPELSEDILLRQNKTYLISEYGYTRLIVRN